MATQENTYRQAKKRLPFLGQSLLNPGSLPWGPGWEVEGETKLRSGHIRLLYEAPKYYKNPEY